MIPHREHKGIMEKRSTDSKRRRIPQSLYSVTDSESESEGQQKSVGTLKRKQSGTCSQRNAEKARKSRDHNRARLQEVNTCLLSSLQIIQDSKTRLQHSSRKVPFQSELMCSNAEAATDGIHLTETNALTRIPGKSFASEILHTAKILKLVIQRYVSITDQISKAESLKDEDNKRVAFSPKNTYSSPVFPPFQPPLKYSKHFHEHVTSPSESPQEAILDFSNSGIQAIIEILEKHQELYLLTIENSFRAQLQKLDALFQKQYQQTLKILHNFDKYHHLAQQSSESNVIKFETAWEGSDNHEENPPIAHSSDSGRRTKAKAKRPPRQGILLDRGVWALGETNSLNGYMNHFPNELPMDLSCTLSSNQRPLCKI